MRTPTKSGIDTQIDVVNFEVENSTERFCVNSKYKDSSLFIL